MSIPKGALVLCWCDDNPVAVGTYVGRFYGLHRVLFVKDVQAHFYRVMPLAETTIEVLKTMRTPDKIPK